VELAPLAARVAAADVLSHRVLASGRGSWMTAKRSAAAYPVQGVMLAIVAQVCPQPQETTRTTDNLAPHLVALVGYHQASLLWLQMFCQEQAEVGAAVVTGRLSILQSLADVLGWPQRHSLPVDDFVGDVIVELLTGEWAATSDGAGHCRSRPSRQWS